MSKTDTVFQLVKSLTQNEKRFFRLFANLAKGEKNYMHVFNAMDSMKTYDAGTLKKKLEGKPMKLSHEQQYLCKQILRSMRVFHSENNAEYQLNGMLSDVKFLAGKEQARLCSEILEAGVKLAAKKQLYPQLVRLLDMKYNFDGNQAGENPKQGMETKAATEAAVNEALEKIALNYTYQPLQDEMILRMQEKLRLRDDGSKKKLEAFMQHPLLTAKQTTGLPANALYTCNTIYQYYHMSNANYKQALKFSQRLNELMENMPEALQLTPRLFYNRANNFMYTALFAKKYDELKDFMQKYRDGYYKKLPIDFSMIGDLMEELMLGYTLSVAIYSKDYAPGLKAIAEYEKKITAYEKIINPEMRVALYYRMARLLFSSGSPRKALVWINRIRNESAPDVRPDTQSYARILNLVIHLELGNYDLLESIVHAAKRFLEKKQMLYKTERVLIEFVKDYLALAKEKERQRLYVPLKEKLTALSKDPLESNAFVHFDYLEWVNRRIAAGGAGGRKILV